jgi:hypothetical protein
MDSIAATEENKAAGVMSANDKSTALRKVRKVV